MSARGQVGRPTVEARVAIGVVPLVVLWASAFTGTTPFYPTILAGSLAMALLAVWVWRSPSFPGLPGQPPGMQRSSGSQQPPGPQLPRGVLRSLPPLRVRAAHVRLAAVVAIIHYLVGAALFVLASRLVPTFAETASNAYERASAAPVWVAVLLGGVVSAPLEEVFWRGAVQPMVAATLDAHSARARKLPLLAIAASAFAYALFHAATFNLALVAAALLGGIVWGWLLQRTGSLGAVMLAHGLWTCLMLAVPPGSPVAGG